MGESWANGRRTVGARVAPGGTDPSFCALRETPTAKAGQRGKMQAPSLWQRQAAQCITCEVVAMILTYPFVSLKSVDELVATLLMLAKQRKSYYAAIQIVRAVRTGIDEPIIHPRASVRRTDDGMAEVTFFRDDAPDDETPGTVNRWQYLDENGKPVDGKVIEVTLTPDRQGHDVTLYCTTRSIRPNSGDCWRTLARLYRSQQRETGKHR